MKSGLRKGFIERVKREGVVDTRRYRYRIDSNYADVGDFFLLKIDRLPISDLNTCAALRPWATVYTEEYQLLAEY